MINFTLFKTSLAPLRRRLQQALYVPAQTGSHDMGDQFMGSLASAYVEIEHFPEAGRQPFRRFQLQAGSASQAR
jgi:hypothetical protein